MHPDPRPIVVGVDDAPSTELAVAWAAEEARVRHVPLRLICAFRPELGRLPAFVTVSSVEVAEPRQVAEQLVASAVVAAAAAGADAAGEAVDGDPIDVLLAESMRATTLVLGSRQLKAFASAVLGTVSAAVAARSQAPTVVVRGPAGRPEDGAVVVVGVDGTEASETVLGYGCAHASRHRVPLRAVLCWHPDPFALMSRRAASPAPARVETWLSEALAGWRERYPDVPVYSQVIREQPAAGLVVAATGQHLLVVGNRGRNALAGTLLGSVSQGVLHHAACPVEVVPTHTVRHLTAP